MTRTIGTVLLVDDDPTALYIARNVLRRLGVAELVLTAHNGQEALQLIRSACAEPNRAALCPRLILVDVKMPVMDGFEFVGALGTMEFPVRPVVAMLSSSQNPRDLRQADGRGVDAYLAKPLTAQSLGSS
ncbi:two-component system response regulator [Rufibacter sediminis]|uniref:Response regulator n=1 Tax=Rufibacter sediminis TaxID=2762756 RepID=A0ABR6VPZ3_9BACT|nr:response regulator [Rufibacter sediminis]MBC3538944.1 response regulator [Rufibacter sediminis]